MARAPHPPGDSTRFFARVTGAVFECPRCGKLYRFGQKVPGADDNARFDKRTSRFQCTECGRQFIFGLLCWPVGPDNRTPTMPRDQVPNERQLAQMRAEGSVGYWMHEKKPRYRADDTNLTKAGLAEEAERPADRLSWTDRELVGDFGSDDEEGR